MSELVSNAPVLTKIENVDVVIALNGEVATPAVMLKLQNGTLINTAVTLELLEEFRKNDAERSKE